MPSPLRRLLTALLVLAPALATAVTVSGRLAAPGRALPALSLYAWSLTAARLYSITTDSGQAGFSLDLPAGRYYVFAMPADPGAPPVYGAYTEFTACSRARAGGECRVHDLKPVVVAALRLEAIDLTDWYLEEDVTRELDRILGHAGGGAPEEAELAAPKFSEYPAAAYTGTPAAAIVAGAEPRIEREREPLTAALGSGANFAGRTVLVRLGCGAGCESVALVDLPSGRVAYPAALATLPAGTRCSSQGPLQFRRDSRLLTVTGRDAGTLVTRYFVWDPDSGILRLVASLASALEERCVPRR